MRQKFMQFPNYLMIEFPCYGKSMRKHIRFKVIGFLRISREAEIHTIPKRWDEWICILQNKYGKTQTILTFCFTLQILRWWKLMQPPMSRNVQIPITWKHSVENHIDPRLWIFQEIWEFFFRFMENRWEYPCPSHSWIWRYFSCKSIQFPKHGENEFP